MLGDILYHGPRNDLPKDYAPKKVIELLNGIKNEILCVRGNCDTEVDQMVLEFPVLADYAVIFVDGKTLYLTHGHKYNPNNEDMGDFTYLNPGSVSIPKGGNPHTYMIYENGEFKIKELK